MQIDQALALKLEINALDAALSDAITKRDGRKAEMIGERLLSLSPTLLKCKTISPIGASILLDDAAAVLSASKSVELRKISQKLGAISERLARGRRQLSDLKSLRELAVLKAWQCDDEMVSTVHCALLSAIYGASRPALVFP